MTDAKLAQIFLETGEKLGVVLIDLRKLDEIHHGWIEDLKKAYNTENPLGNFILDTRDIVNMEGNFLNGDYYLTLHGLRQLQFAFYRKKHYFEDTKSNEGELFCDIDNALDAFYLHADEVFEYRMGQLTNDKREALYDKLRVWSIYRRLYSDASNEISTLICHDATLKTRPVFLEMSLAHQVITQAKYQKENGYEKLDAEEKQLLDALVSNQLFNELESWKI